MKALTGYTSMKKPEKFTKDLLVAERKDMDNLMQWSFDVSLIEDWMEKSRLV